ncbi:MAG: hypothetical protein RL616_1095 [Verrucomicrobiota bacterium]
MENRYDYKKFAVLYVDDEVQSLKYFTLAFGETFRIFTAPNAQAGLKILEEHADEIGILMTDQRMPGEKGVWLLEKARALRPHVLRMLVTAFTDLDAAIAAVNSGAIYKYISKPWDPQQLEQTLKQGLEFFMVQGERDQLLAEKMSVLRNMMIADRIVSLGLLAAGLSHQIKNSMVAVKTFLELAPMKMNEEKASTAELRDPEFWRDYHANVQSQIEKINNLLGDLRSASESNPNSEPFPDEIQLSSALAKRIDGMRDAFAARRLTVENEISETLPTMRVDLPKFDRLFDLLLKDELAMLPAGSKVVITAAVDGSDMVVKVTDNGPALPAAALQVVLDPFTVTGGVPSEYGINLMACFFIAHHHGGKVEAQSLPSGNIFTVRLPLKPERHAAPADDADFMRRALLNENLWGKLLAKG